MELPATEEEIEQVKKNINLDGFFYEEYFITDYENSLIKIDQYDNLERLNELAELLKDLDKEEKKIFKFFMEYLNYKDKEALEKLKEGDFTYYSDVKNKSDLGYALAENMEIPEHLKVYIDYEAIGRTATFDGWYLFENIAIYCR